MGYNWTKESMKGAHMLSGHTPGPLRATVFGLVLLVLAFVPLGTPRPRQGTDIAAEAAQGDLAAVNTSVHFPLVARSVEGCEPVPGATYGTWSIVGDPTDRPAEEHADLNLMLRGYEPTDAYLGLVDYGPPTDPGSPQLTGLFSPPRVASFTAAYQVHQWDWACNCRGPVETDPPATLISVAASPGELVHVPPSGYDIGGGYEALVLYAAPNRITLKYTGEDNVVYGYTIHLESICVDPNLLVLYQQMNAAGRHQLPALRAGQAFARAVGASYVVAIRDTGTFMDPRSHCDWWR
jgi:hypothetical protein